ADCRRPQHPRELRRASHQAGGRDRPGRSATRRRTGQRFSPPGPTAPTPAWLPATRSYRPGRALGPAPAGPRWHPGSSGPLVAPARAELAGDVVAALAADIGRLRDRAGASARIIGIDS